MRFVAPRVFLISLPVLAACGGPDLGQGAEAQEVAIETAPDRPSPPPPPPPPPMCTLSSKLACAAPYTLSGTKCVKTSVPQLVVSPPKPGAFPSIPAKLVCPSPTAQNETVVLKTFPFTTCQHQRPAQLVPNPLALPATSPAAEAAWVLSAVNAKIPPLLSTVMAHISDDWNVLGPDAKTTAAKAYRQKLYDLRARRPISATAVEVDTADTLLVALQDGNADGASLGIKVGSDGKILVSDIEAFDFAQCDARGAVQEIEDWVATFPRFGLYVADLTSSATSPFDTVDVGSDLTPPFASTFKIFVMRELVKRLAAGTLTWDEQLPLQTASPSLVYPTSAASLPSQGCRDSVSKFYGVTAPVWTKTSPITVEWAARYMMRCSDNSATDHLMDRLAGGTIAGRTVFAGYTTSPALNTPFLMTRDTYALRTPQASGIPTLAAYVAAANDDVAQIAMLQTIRDNPVAANGNPSFAGSAQAEWFARPIDFLVPLFDLGVAAKTQADAGDKRLSDVLRSSTSALIENQIGKGGGDFFVASYAGILVQKQNVLTTTPRLFYFSYAVQANSQQWSRDVAGTLTRLTSWWK